MNTQEIIETLRPMANVGWWRVLARQTAECDRLRREAEDYRRSAYRCRQQGDDATALDGHAEEADRHAEKLDQIAREAWRRYWSVFDAVKRHRPELLGVFPFADGIGIDDIDPKAAARSMNELVGKLLAVADDPWVIVRPGDCRGLDRSTITRHADDARKPWIEKIDRGRYRIRQSRLPDYQ